MFYVTNDYNAMPISLEKAKAFLRVASQDDDILITALVKSAVNYAENKFNIVIGKKDYECKMYLYTREFVISKPYLVNVNFVKINNAIVSFTQKGNTIILNDDAPDDAQVCINFTCENNYFGEALEIAILRHVFYLYENRASSEINSSSIELIYNFLIPNNYNI